MTMSRPASSLVRGTGSGSNATAVISTHLLVPRITVEPGPGRPDWRDRPGRASMRAAVASASSSSGSTTTSRRISSITACTAGFCSYWSSGTQAGRSSRRTANSGHGAISSIGATDVPQGLVTTGASPQKSSAPTFRRRSPEFAILRYDRSPSVGVAAMSADILLTSSARGGSRIPPKTASDLVFLCVAGAGFEPATSGL